MSDLGRFVETFMDTHLHRMSFQECLGDGEKKSSIASGTVAAAEFFHRVVSPNLSKRSGLSIVLHLLNSFPLLLNR